MAVILQLGIQANPTLAQRNPLPAPDKVLSGADATLALVGGTLVDGCGGSPLRNSVVLVERERLAAVGQGG